MLFRLGGQRYEMGSEMPETKSVTLRAHLSGATKEHLTWMRNGKSIGETDVPANSDVMLECEARSGDWFTVVVRDGDLPTIFANAIYVH